MSYKKEKFPQDFVPYEENKIHQVFFCFNDISLSI